MRYPTFLPNKGTIGVVAPSFGVSGFPYEERYLKAKEKFNKLGYKIKECKHLYGIEKAASADAKVRAQEFMDMYLDDSVDVIISVAGGEMMMEIIPYIDFAKLRTAKPKWFMGLSDNTNLTFTIPILMDCASIYGSCFGSFGMERWHPALKQAYEIIKGERLNQNSFSKCERVGYKPENPGAYDGYYLKDKVVVKSLSDKDEKVSGRLIGGCLDILAMMYGIPQFDVKPFLEKYKDDGFIWYLEACDLNVLSQKRSLWQLKESGWFKYCKGIVYGRPIHNYDLFGITVKNLLEDIFSDMNIPVIYDCDLGHIAPVWTIIAGSIGTIEKKGDKASISFELK